MSCCCCCPATLAIGAVVLYLIYKFFFKKERKEPEVRNLFLKIWKITKFQLQVQSWEKDTVYLFQFPRTQHLPNLSPFCLKLESFLRVNKIKHEVMLLLVKNLCNFAYMTIVFTISTENFQHKYQRL